MITPKFYVCINIVVSTIIAFCLFVVIGARPKTAIGQNVASVALNESGNIVLSASIQYDKERPPEFEGPWDVGVISEQYQWIYYDVRNTNYLNNIVPDVNTPNLDTQFIADHTDPDLLDNPAFLQELYYMGLYSFGDNYYLHGAVTGVPEFLAGGENTYYAGKYSPPVDAYDGKNLTLIVELPFDATTASDLVPESFEIRETGGGQIGTNHTVHQTEYGDTTGSWIQDAPTCGSTIEDCGFITGDYEFLAFVESHVSVAANVKLVSAYQNDIPVIRFTIIDEDTNVAPIDTINVSKTYIGEAGIEIDTLVINSPASVEFVVANGNGIKINGVFKAALGSSFRTELSGGSSLSKGIGMIPGPPDENAQVGRLVKTKGRVSIFPNPSMHLPDVRIRSADTQVASIEIYDFLGRHFGPKITMVLTSPSMDISLMSVFQGIRFPAGTYLLRLSDDESTETRVFTILN